MTKEPIETKEYYEETEPRPLAEDSSLVEKYDEQVYVDERPRRRGSHSLFAPIVLIAAGVLFLLNNLGVISGFEWGRVFNLWPLALIFLGLNVLVTQIRPPLGTLLSGLVGLGAVGVFAFLLLSSSADGALRSLGMPLAADFHQEAVHVPLDGAESAEVTLELANLPSEISAGATGALLAGEIWTRTGLNLDQSRDGGRLRVQMGEQSGGFMWFYDGAAREHTWDLALSPDVPLDLRLDAGNGGMTADLTGLTLTSLDVDSGNAAVSVIAPDGNYDIEIDSGNGSVNLVLPDEGRRTARIDGGNGAVRVSLPEGVEARVEYDTGNGSVRADGRFRRVSGDGDEGVYETAGYGSAADPVLLILNSGNGSISVTAP